MMQQTYDELVSIPWLSAYRFTLQNGNIRAEGPATYTIGLFNDWLCVNGYTFGTIHALVGYLTSCLPESVLGSYARWYFTENGASFHWQDDNSAIISRGDFAYHARFDRRQIIILKGQEVSYNISTLHSAGINNIIPAPGDNDIEPLKIFYNAAREFKKRYARECPLMHARHKATIGRNRIEIASIAIDIFAPVKYEIILVWELKLTLLDTIKRQLPQPIAEEISDHIV